MHIRHDHAGNENVHPYPDLDLLSWPVLGVSLVSWPFLGALWEHAPTPTGIYMAVSAAFMLFQMSDKLGLLDRFKKRPAQEPPDNPES